jgi:hypothetical protein
MAWQEHAKLDTLVAILLHPLQDIGQDQILAAILAMMIDGRK